MVPIAVLALVVLTLAAPLLVVAGQPRAERGWLWRAVAAALVLRLVVALALHWSGAWQLTDRGAVTPDEATTDLGARLLVRGDPRSPVELAGSLHTAWLLVSWSLYDLVWDSLVVMELLSAVLGALLLVPAYLLGRQLHSARAGRWAAVAVAVFPNALVWSALALRESLIALVLLTVLTAAVVPLPAGRPGRAGWLAATAWPLVLVTFTRSYMLPLLAVVLLGVGLVRALGARRLLPLLGPVLAVALALGVVAALPTGVRTLRTTVALVAEPAGNIYNPLSGCDSAADCPAAPSGPPQRALPGSQLHAEPGADDGQDLSASLESVGRKGVVRAFAIAVLGGRPVWRTAEFFFLLQPGVLLWWTLLPLVAAGAVALAARRQWDGLVVTVGYPAAVVVFLAYSGQFLRHHYMLEPVGLVLAAVGASALRVPAAQRPGARLRPVVATAMAVLGVAALASVALSLRPGGADPPGPSAAGPRDPAAVTADRAAPARHSPTVPRRLLAVSTVSRDRSPHHAGDAAA